MPTTLSSLLNSAFRQLRRRWRLLTILLLTGLVTANWLFQRQQANQPDLRFQHPIRQDITKTLEVSGVVDADEKASLRFLAGGKLTFLGVRQGDRVKKGQVIATIDQRTLKKELEKDINDFLKERWDLEQLLDDNGDPILIGDIATRRTIDKQQFDLESSVLDVEIRDIAVRNSVMTAPFDGILVSSPADTAGITLLSSQTFELVNPTTLFFRAEVDEADIGQVKEGQPAKITLDAFPDDLIETYVDDIAFTSGQSSSGTVFHVDLALTTTSGSSALLTIDNLNTMRLGMNGDVEIVLESRQDVLTVPLIATRSRDRQLFVDVMTGPESFEERPIEAGLETDELVEVLSGLTEDDQVMIPE
ncbi:MAG: hypothetical protein COU69_04005 [Candidatus Pacebacteria bacterium CG10_big_fil_rev_8_21_14_0_10_56_10]|nr:MAG: hypothetical protein COU69_04005 [Candidatus Pacebacteria bacterium CG10_big_fil_rev_8_21_14_0_10_56_10]